MSFSGSIVNPSTYWRSFLPSWAQRAPLTVAINWLWRANSNRSILRTCCGVTSRNMWLATRVGLRRRSWTRRLAYFSCSAWRATQDAPCRRSRPVSKPSPASEKPWEPNKKCNQYLLVISPKSKVFRINKVIAFDSAFWFAIIFGFPNFRQKTSRRGLRVESLPLSNVQLTRV